MSQDALMKAVSGIAAQLKAHPELITQHLGTLQKQFPDLTEAKLTALVAQLSASDLDLGDALGAAKGLFSK